ncbi:MAG TPA: FecR family protein [Parafilimonas sp.]|nr:FecR family protein [Parafilimonas sp.]
MLYENYTVEDFLLDASFQKYCLGADDEAILFWKEWISVHPQKKEEIEKARELYFILNGNHTNEQFVKHREKFRNTISTLLNSQGENKTSDPVITKGIVRKLLSKKILGISAAASVIIIIGVALLTQNKQEKTLNASSPNIIASGQNEHKIIELPDGSKVILNAKSIIHLDDDFNDKSRELSLSGEAFFDVAHDASKPFIIHTQYMDVKVLGTVFNVKAYPNEKLAETSLLKGSVELTLKKAHNKKIILKPNEKISINTSENDAVTEPDVIKNSLHLNKTHTAPGSDTQKDSAIAALIWNKGNLVFENSSFEDIATKLQQWFGVTINFEDDAIKQYRFTGDFSDKTVIQVLNALQLSRSFNYQVQDSTQIMVSK